VEATQLKLEDCKIYRIKAMTGAKGYQAREWGLSNPMATVDLHFVTRDDDMYIKFLKDGKLFAKSVMIEGRKICSGDKMLEYYLDKVSDSSRYFVLKIENPKTKKILTIGFGFSDRDSPATLNACVDDHLQQIRRQIEYEKQKASGGSSGGGAGDDDDDDLFSADFAKLRGPSSSGAAVMNLAPPPVEPISGPSAEDGKRKKKKKKKKKKKGAQGADASKFGDDFDADFADFGDFESGNTANNAPQESSQQQSYDASGWEASFDSGMGTSSPSSEMKSGGNTTASGNTANNANAVNDILGLFS